MTSCTSPWVAARPVWIAGIDTLTILKSSVGKNTPISMATSASQRRRCARSTSNLLRPPRPLLEADRAAVGAGVGAAVEYARGRVDLDHLAAAGLELVLQAQAVAALLQVLPGLLGEARLQAQL